MDTWDGLRGCEQCGNDTASRLCHSCREQEMIDNSDYSPLCCPVCHSFSVFATDDEFTEFECEKCGHEWKE